MPLRPHRDRPPEIAWCELPSMPRVGLMARPPGGSQLRGTLRALRGLGVDQLVSLLADDEVSDLELEAAEQHASALELPFLRLPIADHDVPPCADAFVAALDRVIERGPSTIVCHCHAGIGRSSLAAATLLVRAGAQRTMILPALKRARGVAVPETPAQARWLRDEILTRGSWSTAAPG